MVELEEVGVVDMGAGLEMEGVMDLVVAVGVMVVVVATGQGVKVEEATEEATVAVARVEEVRVEEMVAE